MIFVTATREKIGNTGSTRATFWRHRAGDDDQGGGHARSGDNAEGARTHVRAEIDADSRNSVADRKRLQDDCDGILAVS